jgi:alkaline phosphatase D
MSSHREIAIGRRLLLYGGAAAAVAPMLMRPEGGYAQSTLPVPADVFRLGVASGDPLPDGIVLWTRLAPEVGMPARPVDVQWEIAADEQFRRERRSGAEVARPELAHSVHVDVRGLRPDAEYHYRFRVGGQISPVGRTRTAPLTTGALRFAFTSCQNYQDGYFTAYQHLVEEDVAFVAFLGDYIYEYKRRPTAVREHEGTTETYTLQQYRDRYTTYKTDPDLQAVHAAFPWIVTLDDHEVDGNWADEQHPPDARVATPAASRARRAAAFQAYYEHMPLRRTSLPRGVDMQLYRRLRFGSLIDLHVLDTRQYRSVQPTTVAGSWNKALTMTGARQEKWLVDGLRQGGVRWNLLANQVMWAENDRTAGFRQSFDFDNWDGYRVQRERLLKVFAHVVNPVILTGDRHATWVCDLRTDFEDPSTPIVGAEITGTSITSGGNEDPAAFHALFDPIMKQSPHWRYIDNHRGYVVCDVNGQRLQARLRVVDTVWAQAASVRTAATFTVEAGRPGIAEVSQAAPPPAAPAKIYSVWPR